MMSDQEFLCAVYQSPQCSGRGRYEWPLWRRVVYACLVLVILYLAAAVASWWQTFRRDPNHCRTPLVPTVVRFLTDWR